MDEKNCIETKDNYQSLGKINCGNVG